MGDLTNNLSRHEVACHCGCGLDTADFQTVNIVQEVCDEFNCAVTINSWSRCYEYNRSEDVKSNNRSQHPKGKAADCVFHGVSPQQVADYLNSKYPDSLGIGIYETFIHIDSRPNRSRW